MKAAVKPLRKSRSVVGREGSGQPLWNTEQESLRDLLGHITVTAKGQVGHMYCHTQFPRGEHLTTTRKCGRTQVG